METIFAPYLWLSCVFKETLHLLEKLVEWKPAEVYFSLYVYDSSLHLLEKLVEWKYSK